MNALDWVSTSRESPPEEKVVWAMDSGGHVQKLKRQGRLWWFPDGSMYVYFTPMFWKPLPEETLCLKTAHP